MVIRYTCPCGEKLRADTEFSGERIRCPRCGEKLIIPDRTGSDALMLPSPIKRPPPEIELGRARKWLNERSGRAVVAFVLGLFSPVLLGIGGVVAVVIGILGLMDISRGNNQLKGKRLAISGVALGGIGIPVGYFAAAVVLSIVLQRITQAKVRLETHHNMALIELALVNFENAKGRLPPLALTTRDGKPGLSWRVTILPYLGEKKLFEQFALDEPWDSPTNLALLPRIPREYIHTSRAATTTPGYTHYRVFTGPQTPFPDWQTSLSIRDFIDDPHTTILVVESSEAVPWTKPDDLPYSRNQPLPRLGGLSGEGFAAIAVWGERYFFDAKTDEEVIRAFITCDGRESIPVEFRNKK